MAKDKRRYCSARQFTIIFGPNPKIEFVPGSVAILGVTKSRGRSALTPSTNLLRFPSSSLRMAPSTALQARIRQFESLDNARVVKASGQERPSYPPLREIQRAVSNGTGGSASSSQSSDPMGEPVSPTASSYSIIAPSVPYVPRKSVKKSPSPSPPNLGLKTSLIDLREWVVEDGPNSRMRLASSAQNDLSVRRFVRTLSCCFKSC